MHLSPNADARSSQSIAALASMCLAAAILTSSALSMLTGDFGALGPALALTQSG